MDPDVPTDAQHVVTRYLAALERQYEESDPFPMPLSTLPYPKPIIKQSMRTLVGSLTANGQLTDELSRLLEIAYAALADYLDDEMVQVMREYRAAMSDLDGDGRIGREKTTTAAWRQISETSSLVSRIAQAAAEEGDSLRAEFHSFQPLQQAVPASPGT